MQAINDSLNAVDALLASTPVKNGTQYSTLLTCEEVLSDSLDQLNDSLSQISNLSLQFLQSEVQDVQQLLSAAMTSQDTCLTDIHEFGIWNSTSVVNGTLATYATQLLSNALALVTALTKITGLTNLIPSLHNRRLLLSAADDDAHLAQSKSSYQMELDLHSAIEVGSQAFPGWMRAADRRLLQTVKPTPNAVVAQDGSGQYKTIQAAVNAAKTGTNSRWVIYVKAGTYSEQVTIGKSAKNLMLYGDGAGLTILTGSKNVAGGSTTFLSATLGKQTFAAFTACCCSSSRLQLLLGSRRKVGFLLSIL